MTRPRTPTLDTSRMTVHHDDLGWRFVDHDQQLATSGFTTHAALMKNATGFAVHPTAMASMRQRYQRMHGHG